jgi:hypothetical protein
MTHSKNGTLAAVVAAILVLAVSVPAETASLTFLLTAENAAILPAPLSMEIEGLSIPQPHTARLCRIDGDKKIPLACQTEVGHTMRVWYILDKKIEQGQSVPLELAIEATAPPAGSLTASVDAETVTLGYQSKPILSYYRAVHPVPEGVDPIYRRSGFIHPLYTPDGMVVTRIQPRDHYHHYGIWNPWTVTQIEGREVDFWNLAKGQGTVRFAELLSTIEGPVYSGFRARQEHVMFIGDAKTEKIAINEVWDVRAAAMTLDGRTVWAVDFTTTLSNALQSEIELSAYRYGGGLGFRATDDWNKDNLVVLTSEGKTRSDADGTGARWADIRGSGRNKSGTAGVLFLSHVANREHPEPMRVWPENGGPNGVMFFEFCPIRHNAWTLKPNTDYVLRYRMLIYDGKINPDTAETLWKNFSQPPVPVRTAQAAL